MSTKNDQDKAAAKSLIAMTKDGEVIKVCKAQVEQHKALGWVMVSK